MDDDMSCGFVVFLVITLVIIGYVIYWVPSKIVALTVPDTTTEQNWELASINDRFSQEANGSFFLMMGTYNLEEVAKYWFYRKEGEGYKLNSLDVNGIEEVFIVEDEQKSPHQQKICKGRLFKECKNYFHIPKGSITRQYNLDIK